VVKHKLDAIKANLPRINNNVEAWHRELETLVGTPHKNLWKSINNFQKEQALSDVTMVQCV